MVSAEVPVFFLRFSLGRGEEKMKEKDTTIGQAPIRDARTLGAPRMLVLGLQHMFAMFGATVLVPILVQSYGLPLSTQTTLFFAGFGICARSWRFRPSWDHPLPFWAGFPPWRI